MADNTTTTTDGTVIDLRPADGSVVHELLRLGLRFDHKDAGGETWVDYTKRDQATFTYRDTATEVIISDMDTKETRTVKVADLKNVTDIMTWASDGVKTTGKTTTE